MKVYLDNAATTTIDSEVFEAMIPVLKDGYGNPSSSHFHGRKSKSIIERARKNIAKASLESLIKGFQGNNPSGASALLALFN